MAPWPFALAGRACERRALGTDIARQWSTIETSARAAAGVITAVPRGAGFGGATRRRAE